MRHATRLDLAAIAFGPVQLGTRFRASVHLPAAAARRTCSQTSTRGIDGGGGGVALAEALALAVASAFVSSDADSTAAGAGAAVGAALFVDSASVSFLQPGSVRAAASAAPSSKAVVVFMVSSDRGRAFAPRAARRAG